MSRLLLLLTVCAFAYLVAGSPGADAAVRPLFLYVHDQNPNAVFGFRFNGDGSMTPVANSPFSANTGDSDCGGNCETAAFSSKKDLLAVSGSGGVSTFRVAANGTLSLIPGSPFGGVTHDGVAIVERGNRTFVYAASLDTDQIFGYEAQSDGTLGELANSPFAAGDEPVGLTSVKDLLFAANEDDNTISAYKVAKDGTLTAAPNTPLDLSASFIYNLQVDPKGRFLYAADATLNTIYSLKIKNKDASLTSVTGSPFGDPLFGTETLALNKKSLLFSIPFGGPSVHALRRSSSGALTPLGSSQDAGSPDVIGGVFDPSGKFLVLVDQNNNFLRSFSVSNKTGVILPVDTENPALSSGEVTGLVFARP